ncbi:RDD family protein [Streptomyces sp. enrichment culture]|uniref:RDD family protein n=1 Tax=Streptomyces sp. enrichment culture TaxID=1795815 RepID=UPI003F55C9FF
MPSDHAQATGTAVPPPGPTPPAGQYESGIVLAGRARRLAARVLDMAVWAVVSAPVTGLVTTVTQEGDTRAVAGMGAAALVWLVLHPLALSRFGSTLGKAALGVRIARMRDGSRPGFLQALSRECCYLFLTVIPLVGLVNAASCLWDEPYHRCWHDNVAGTLAVDRKAFAARRAAVG